jgi:chloramphenicol 3-O phosphotransferase
VRYRDTVGAVIADRAAAELDEGRARRSDRRNGRFPSRVVHQGVVYDLQVDPTNTEALECAEAIAAHVP